MKLEKYLADYIAHDIASKEDFLTYIKHGCFNFEEVIKEGLDAFESTEDVKIMVISNNSEIQLTHFKVLCPCNMELRIDDGTTVICPDCGRELDDRGNVL